MRGVKNTHNAFVFLKLGPQSLALMHCMLVLVQRCFDQPALLIMWSYLTEPKIATHGPVQDGFQRASVQVQRSLLLQSPNTHRRIAVYYSPSNVTPSGMQPSLHQLQRDGR